MKLTAYGTKELLISAGLTGITAASLVWGGSQVNELYYYGIIVPASFMGLILYFFRDPTRIVPDDADAFMSPADGVISHVEEVDEPDFIGGKALRVSIFLSVFNVHINRACFPGKVAYNAYKKGEFVNAMRGDSGHLNERNDMGLTTEDERVPKYMLRQVAGLIARRIVCDVTDGQELARGEQYGMIKFSSRTDLFLPIDTKFELNVKPGDKVRAGLTVIGKLTS